MNKGNRYRIRARVRAVVLVAAALAAYPSWAGLVGLWEFDAGSELSAVTGNDLTATGSYTPMTGHSTGDGAVAVGPGSYFTATHGIAPNGGGSYVNEWTLLVDFKYPTLGWISFFQTNTGNANDGDCFVRGGGGVVGSIGVSETGYGSEATATETWYRMVISVDNGNFYRIYLNGDLYLEGTASGLDGRFSLDPVLLLFADNNGEDNEIHVSAAALWDVPLTEPEIAALSTPGVAIEPDPNNQLPTVAAQPAGPTAVDTGVSASYNFTPSDPDGNEVRVQADLGNGSLSSWSAFGASGAAQSLDLTWSSPGTFSLRARAQDLQGGISDWVDIQSVTVTGAAVVTFTTPPYLQNVRQDGIVIMCETDEDVPLGVEYGLDTGYGTNVPTSRVASGGGTWFHRAILTGLDAGTHYHYRMTASDGTPKWPDKTFKTAPDGEVDFKFSFWSDSQGHNHNAWSAEPLEPTISMMQHMVGAEVDFGFTTGDLAENGGSYSDVRSYYLDRVARHLGAAVPWFAAWGNHDTSNPNSPLRLASDMPSRYRAGYTPGHGSFTFTYANCFFVCIDNMYRNADLDNGWVEAQLASPEAQNARFRFVGVHVPPYCERWIDGDSALRSKLVPLLEKYNVNFCLSGHTHEYERGGKSGTDQHGEDHHVHYVISGNGSWLDHSEPIAFDWDHMTVGGAHNVPGNWAQQSSPGVLGTPQPIVGGLFNGYALITIREDYLHLQEYGFNADGSVIGVMDSLEVGIDPGPDTDSDGMRDPWEIANGLDHTSTNGVNGAEGDLDEDGHSNIDEMNSGNAANDPLSVFNVTALGENDGSGYPLTWSSVPGKQYKILVSENLSAWTPLMDSGEAVIVDAAPGTSTTYLVMMPSEQQGFARVEVLVD